MDVAEILDGCIISYIRSIKFSSNKGTRTFWVTAYFIGRLRISPRVNKGKLDSCALETWHNRTGVLMSLTDEDKNWITEQLGEDRNRMTEEIRTVETSLLTEFHKWASPSEARQRTHAAALRAIDLEMESLSERVAKLEGK
jgi:hypothetical protein